MYCSVKIRHIVVDFQLLHSFNDNLAMKGSTFQVSEFRVNTIMPCYMCELSESTVLQQRFQFMRIIEELVAP